MQNNGRWCVWVLLPLFLCGCFTTHRKPAPALPPEGPVATSPFPPYAGPKIAVGVSDFEVTVVKASGEIGAGLREMFMVALANSNHFTISQNEQPAGASSVAPAAAVGPIQLPRLLIAARVVAFDPESSGGAGGVGGGGGGNSGLMGGLLDVSQDKARIALDVRLVDASTNAVIAATQVQGQASDLAGPFMSAFFGGWPLGAALKAYAHTPMEKAMRICIIEAVRYIVQNVPAGYYGL